MGQARRRRDAERRSDEVVLAYIHPGTVSGYFTEALLATYAYEAGTKRRIVNVLQEWSSANVSQSRNTVTQRFLDGDRGDWLLWVDADMHWDPSTALDLLLESADPIARPIVGGLCFGMWQGRLFPTIYQWTELPSGDLTTVRVGDYPRDRLVQCAATGAAFLLIHRSILQTIRDREFNRTFPWFQEVEMGGQPVGEDLTFCIRAGICGAPVHVDTRVKVGHHKSVLLTEDMFDAQEVPL